MNGTYITGSAEETADLAVKLVSSLKEGTTLLLEGGLGAGKTTFTSGIGHYFNLGQLTSPTYTIVHHYPIRHAQSQIKNLYHVDLYRLNSYWEIKAFSIDELWESKQNLIVVEWPDRLGDFIPKNRIEVKFKDLGVNTREIELKSR